MSLVPPLTSGPTPDGDAPREPGVEQPAAGAGEDGTPERSTPRHRRHPSTWGGAFYLVILATTVAGLVIVSTGRWRTGVHWIAGALVAAAVLRAVLPTRDAGMLAVRSRWFDAGLLVGVGVVLWFLATSIPNAG